MSKKYPILDDYNWLYTKYIKEELSTIAIAKIVGCNYTTIVAALKEKKIPLRSRSEAVSMGVAHARMQKHPFLEDYDWLYQKYRIERMSSTELALVIGCSITTVLSALRRLNIPIYTLSAGKRGKFKWSEARKKSKSGKNNHNYGKSKSEETRKRLSLSLKKRYEDPVKLKALLKASAKRPTKPEKKCLAILDKSGLPYKYVGDGAVVIGRKCPDFIHLTKKIVIEVFGRAFHSPLLTFKKSMPYHQTYDGTMAHYKKHGYKCVIIWDTDLEREDAEAFVLAQLKKAGVI